MLLPGMDGTGDLLAPLLAVLDAAVPTVLVRYPDEPLDYAAPEGLARAALPTNQRYLVLGESFSGADCNFHCRRSATRAARLRAVLFVG